MPEKEFCITLTEYQKTYLEEVLDASIVEEHSSQCDCKEDEYIYHIQRERDLLKMRLALAKGLEIK